MGSTIDKNDVDISRLFHYSQEFKLKLKGEKEFTVYLRVVGDAELNQARVFALRESAVLRKKLKDKESSEHLAYIPDLEPIPKEDLIKAIVLLRVPDITRQITRETRFNLPIEPLSTASLEDQEEYQEEIDNFDDDLQTKIKEAVEKETKELEKTLKTWTIERLQSEYINYTINQLCEFTMVERFKAMVTYLSIYRDNKFKQRLFKSFDEFDNLPKEIKDQFIKFYDTLEINEDNLKK